MLVLTGGQNKEDEIDSRNCICERGFEKGEYVFSHHVTPVGLFSNDTPFPGFVNKKARLYIGISGKIEEGR
jgi:hypothetical protein